MAASKLSQDIVSHVGGIENIDSMTHCMTRLRFMVKDKEKVNKEKIEGLKGVTSSLYSGGQYQIVIGQDVADVYEDILNNYDLSGNKQGKSEPNNEGNKNKKSILSVFDQLFSVLASIFTPLIPAMAGMGFLKVILVMADLFGASKENTTYQLINILSDAFFYFLPFLVAWSASERFKTNKALSLMLVGFLLHPNLNQLFEASDNVTFLGIGVPEINYVGSILPAILTVLLLSYVEKFLNKSLPKLLRTVFSSVLALLITMPIAILIIGPIGNWGGAILVNMFNNVYEFSPMLSGALMGGLWQLTIIVGMHWLILTLIQFPNISNFGVDHVTVAFVPSIMCQIAAGFAVALKVKNKAVKQNATSLTVTSLLSGGVIEPVMYGVNIKYRKPFYFVLVGGTIGGAITGASGAGITAPVMFGIYTLPAFFGNGFTGLMIGTFVGCAITFLLTYFFGVDKAIEEKQSKELEFTAADVA
jgi:beta-glucoside PTS system EIICBA component